MASLPELRGGSPFRQVSRLQRQIDRLFDEFADWGKSVTAFTPPVDIEEEENRYLLTLDIPGTRKSEIKIEVTGTQLKISGERKEKKHEKEGKGLYRSERFYGVFERVFPLPPDAKTDQIEAVYEDGVLSVSVPKAAGGKPRQIEIKSKEKKEAA